MNRSTTRRVVCAFAVLCAATGWGSSAAAATVFKTTFEDGFTDGEKAVIAAAVQWWEAALPKGLPVLPNRLVEVTFEKGDLGAGVAGEANGTFLTNSAGEIVRPDTATVTFSNRSDITWFIDQSPHEEEEFSPVETADPNPFDDTDKTFFNKFTALPGDDFKDARDGIDLLTIAKHELGHVLGWVENSPRLIAAAQKLGATLDPNETNHLDPTQFHSDLMSSAPLGPGVRQLQSPLDIRMLKEAFGYTVDETPSHVVPLPATPALGLALLAWAGLSGTARPRTPGDR